MYGPFWSFATHCGHHLHGRKACSSLKPVHLFSSSVHFHENEVESLVFINRQCVGTKYSFSSQAAAF